jgi:hypothetical protein
MIERLRATIMARKYEQEGQRLGWKMAAINVNLINSYSAIFVFFSFSVDNWFWLFVLDNLHLFIGHRQF